MVQEQGTISINTENIFPIIKKFLYSDHEIFLRELVSNAVDASQKMKRLATLGHYKGELGELKIQVAFDADAKTITITDNGIGLKSLGQIKHGFYSIRDRAIALNGVLHVQNLPGVRVHVLLRQ